MLKSFLKGMHIMTVHDLSMYTYHCVVLHNKYTYQLWFANSETFNSCSLRTSLAGTINGH